MLMNASSPALTRRLLSTRADNGFVAVWRARYKHAGEEVGRCAAEQGAEIRALANADQEDPVFDRCEAPVDS
jgi:hypothetical protein